MVSHCSLAKDRPLTRRLIEISDCSFKSSHPFANTSEWTDGLDLWSTSPIIEKNQLTRRNLDFSAHIGLYLPRRTNPKSALVPNQTDFISSTSVTNHLFPKRLRQLFKKEKQLFNQDHTDDSPSDEENPSSNELQQSINNRIKSTRSRFPMRHVPSSHCSRESTVKQPDDLTCQSASQDRFKIMLKKQLNKLFSKETIDLNCRGTVMRIPSLEMKQRSKTSRSISAADSSSIIERYTKLRHVLTSPRVDEVPTNGKPIDHRQPSATFRGLSTLGLTVTPLAFSSSKNLHNASNEPPSQSVFRSGSGHPSEDQRLHSRRSFERGLISLNDSFSNKTSLDEQTQVLRNFHRHHRLTAKTAVHRSKISELLPTVTTEKCFLIPISSHRNS